MEVKAAIRGAGTIIHEERQRPTVTYRDVGVNWIDDVKRITEDLKNGTTTREDSFVTMANGSRRLNIWGMRKQKNRTVSETPEQYVFESLNYGLLLKLFNQVRKEDQREFVDALLSLVRHSGDAAFQNGSYAFPKFEGYVSELPLIAEFAIRTGYKEQLFASMSAAQIPTTGLAIMMMEIEETISFNFNLFSEADCQMMPGWLGPLREMADLQTHSASGQRGGKMVQNPHYKSGRSNEAKRIVSCIDNIFLQIGQAQYQYLKGALQQAPNLEIEGDKAKVVGFLASLGFDPALTRSLNAAEQLFRNDASGFELKSCLGHFRSFVEQLHIQACDPIAAANGEQVPQKWGKAISFLRTNGIISQLDETFVTSLYTLVSDEAIHPLIAEQEYARIRRNMIIEYGLMFLTVLAKEGLFIRASTTQTTTGT